MGGMAAADFKWASLVRMVDPVKLETLGVFELKGNQHATSICILQWAGYQEHYIWV